MEQDVTPPDSAVNDTEHDLLPDPASTEEVTAEQVVNPTIWQAPEYDFSLPSRKISAYSLKSDGGTRDNFFRTARWCIDGSAILTTSEDRTIQLFSTPAEISHEANVPSPLSPYLTLPQPSPILSSLWYPTATPSAPETFCFAAAVRDAPVKLIDGITGLTRATYPIVDHRERFVAPYSMAWNSSATKLYCGHENAIEVLDISVPGYDTSERIKTTQTRGDKGGQKGIISALAFSTGYSGLYAAGSFSGSVSLYSEDQAGAVGHLEGIQGGGVTQLAFHPLNPTYLFIASRQSTHLQTYDLRNPSQPIHSFPRLAQTNQRLTFDIDPWGRYIGIGDQEGKVGIWGVGSENWGEKIFEGKESQDAVSSVQFHPLKPSLLVSSGSRRFDHSTSYDSESDSDSDIGSDSDSDSNLNSSRADDRVDAVNEIEVTMEDRQNTDIAVRPVVQQDETGLKIISFGSSPATLLS